MQKNAICNRSELYLLPAVLQMFAGEAPANGTYSDGLSAEMRTYYSDYLIDNAEPYLAHDLFAQKHKIPRGAKTISFRKYDPLPKRMTPITEGVTPDGQNLRVSVVEATVAQILRLEEAGCQIIRVAIPDEAAALERVYSECRGISIDYAVMEKADNIYTIPADFGWSDLGTWGSLWTLKEKTEEGNAIVGEDVRMIDSKDCIVHAPGLSKVIVQGLDGYIISQHGDRLLVCRKDHEQKITDYIK